MINIKDQKTTIDLQGKTLPRFIVVEGSIGVGKTTLAKRMAETFNYQTLLEKADENPFLEAFYQNKQSNALDTQLFFLFGRSDTCMPHFHAQVVQFAPEACVFNADYLPRLDPVDHPEYFTEVFAPITKPYWKAINDTDNICALAPANPAIAAYLSPWSIGCGRPTTRAELDRVAPQIDAFLAHYLTLAGQLAYQGPDAGSLRERDHHHLDLFFADQLDPRAWKGVYGVIGEDIGHRIKDIVKSELRA